HRRAAQPHHRRAVARHAMDTFASRIRRVAASLAMLLGALAPAAPAVAQFVADAYEDEPQINAGRLLAPEQLQSGSHRLRDVVRVDASGNLLRFELESDFGSFDITSEVMLRERVHEVRVLAQAIDQFRRADEPLAQRLRGQLEVGAASWVDIVTSPLSTSGRLLEQLAGNVGQTLTEFGEFPDAPADTGRGGSTPREDTAQAAYRRSVATQLDLDPYSSNARVQDFLDAVAQARAGGRVSGGALSVRVPRAPHRAVADGAIDAAVRSALAQNTPTELDGFIADTLRGRQVPEPLVDAFLGNAALSPRHRSVITAHLDFMAGVGGVAHLVDAARGARDELDALAFEQVVRLFAGYHEQVAPLVEFRRGGALPVADDRDGRVVWALPVDLVYWNEQADRTFSALATAAGGRGIVVLLPGIVTDRARTQLERRGIDVRARFLDSE
ncbi:MAG: hypothetical protein KDC48_19605, partial [Planctomycetes bacterium]|nr:hypothetical protein [Planctomycetota bacterium]